MHPIDEPRRRRTGAAGRAALAERMEWRGTGGRGFGEYYWLVGRRAVESDLGGIFGCGGEDFRAVGGGVWSMVGLSKCSPTCQ